MGKYSSSPLWADIQPIPLSDGPSSTASTSTNAPHTTTTTSAATTGALSSASSSSTLPSAAVAVPALATIAYSPKYSEAMSYLRAVMARNEFSERCLALTEDIISMNPAHYTVWLYRAKVLLQLEKMDGYQEDDVMGGDDDESRGAKTKSPLPGNPQHQHKKKKYSRMEDELHWLEGISLKHLKNYQIWHHRQLLISHISALPDTETAFLARVLALDVKNYHVWTYRQWLCGNFPALAVSPTELAFTDQLIHDDVRNNSAWSHRWFLVFGLEDIKSKQYQQQLEQQQKSKGGKKPSSVSSSLILIDEDILDREIAYAQAKILLAPQNQSPWLYLRGVMRKGGRSLTDLEDFAAQFVADEDDDAAPTTTATDPNNNPPTSHIPSSTPPLPTPTKTRKTLSSHAVDLLAECAAQKGEITRAKKYLHELGQKWDPVRKNYWDWRARMLELEEEEEREGEDEGDGER